MDEILFPKEDANRMIPALDWLLGNPEPALRHLVLRDLLDRQPDDAELRSARQAAHREGLIPAVLAEMHPEGYWVEPGPGYNPKYRSTVWALSLLAQLGASAAEDERIGRGCAYLLDHALTDGGQFSASGAPSGTADCLQGNMLWSLVSLGHGDPRLDRAVEWTARSVTGEGVAPSSDRQAALRYYAGKCGPDFACGSNNRLPCAWGAVKVLLALAKIPLDQRSPLVKRAIERGAVFLFSVDPLTAAYPSGWVEKPSQNWWKFGFPVFYVTDLLQVAEALVALGYGADPRLAGTLAMIAEKRDSQGRWPLEYDYSGKTWGDYGVKKQPNPWVTLRALRVLKAAHRIE